MVYTKTVLKTVMIVFVLLTLVGCNKEAEKANNITEQEVEAPITEEKTPEAEDQEAVVEKDKIVEIGVKNLNVREDFTSTSEVLGQLHWGDTIKVRGEFIDENNRLWYQVYFKHGLGYIASWFTLDP